ncbi:hypothetical protein Tco_1347686 [Tanacetum coccineum]
MLTVFLLESYKSCRSRVKIQKCHPVDCFEIVPFELRVYVGHLVQLLFRVFLFRLDVEVLIAVPVFLPLLLSVVDWMWRF